MTKFLFQGAINTYLWRILGVEVCQPLHVLVRSVSGAQIAVQQKERVQDEGRQQQQSETDPGAVRRTHLGDLATLRETYDNLKSRQKPHTYHALNKSNE